MKKPLIVLLGILVVSLVGCGDDEGTASNVSFDKTIVGGCMDASRQGCVDVYSPLTSNFVTTDCVETGEVIYSAGCPTSGLVGSCHVPATYSILRYYGVTVAEATESCTIVGSLSGGSTFLAN